MALIDHFDKRALGLAAVPLALYVLLVARCLLPPSLGLGSTLPFAGVLLLFYGPVFYLALFRAWGGPWWDDAGFEDKRGFWSAAGRSPFARMGPGLLLVLFTLWVTRWYWGLVSGAKDDLEPKELLPGIKDPFWEPQTGLDVFPETLPVMGVFMPLVVVGILWFLLPKRP